MIKPANTGTISDYKQGLPQMNDVLRGWFIELIFVIITKSQVDYETVEVETPITFQGVRQPLSPQKIAIKPEGQRKWRWEQIHAELGTELNIDDIIKYNDVRYRVMMKLDYEEYGYIEYHIAEAYNE